MKDIPYSELKQDRRAYEIMLLRDQHNNSYADIAKEYEFSIARVRQIYNRLKMKQVYAYINHIAVALGYEDISQVRKVFNAAYESYQDLSYVCAYLEQKYINILTEYRAGEPGMPAVFLTSMPPLRPQLSDGTIARIIELREAEKASFDKIAKELHLTREKVKHTYSMFYHKQALELIGALQENAKSQAEKTAIWNSYFKRYRSYKKLYDALKMNENAPLPCHSEEDSDEESFFGEGI